MDHGAAIINTVVYLGNSICGILGGIFAVLGFIVFPFIIIILIFFFIKYFQNTDILNNFFIGSLCYIFILIIQSMIKLGKSTLVNKTSICIFTITLVSTLFMDIPILVYIIIAGIIGGISKKNQNLPRKSIFTLIEAEKEEQQETQQNATKRNKNVTKT